jgi:putative phosphoribosyl transferase
VAIIIDDGLATGLTVKAALADLRRQQPKKIVLAVPVAPADSIRELSGLADEVVALSTPKFFGSIGAYYKKFDQVSDEEVVDLMKAMSR